MSDSQGRFAWYELMAPDVDAASRFYGSVAGWGTEQWPEGGTYTMWTNGGAPIGGIVPIGVEERAGKVPRWLAYVSVRDVDATAARAARLGATVVREPQDIPGGGRFAVLRDPQGASIGILSGSDEQGAGEQGTAEQGNPAGAMRRGDFSWHELMTTDHAAAFDFYNQLFGWEKTDAFDMGAMGMYQMYGQNGRTYGGMFDKAPDMPFPPNWLCYIHVDSVDRAVDAVTGGGGKVVNGPMEVPGGDWIAQCEDPQGAAFAVHASKR